MYSVLIVDDEKIVKLAIKSMIKWADSEFELAGTASDGYIALKMCEKNKPDIIITDLKMPHMDGIELIKKLNEMNFDGEILVLSNYNDFELVREAMKYGAHDYILKVTVKSDDFMRILEEIKEKLKKKRGHENIAKTQGKSLEFERYECFKKLLLNNEEEIETKSHEISKMFEIEQDMCIQTFIVTCSDEDAISKTGQKIDEIFKNIVGNVISNCNWQSVVDFENRAVFIAINLNKKTGIMSSKEIAERMTELARMYFNLKIGVVYSNTAETSGATINEMGKCKKSFELLFYDDYSEMCISNDHIPNDDEKYVKEVVLQAAEEIYSGVVRGQIDVIMKSFEALTKAGAQSFLNPFRLKKLIKKVLRDVEKRLINNGFCDDEVFDGYYNDQDVIATVASETGLLVALKKIVESALLKTSNKKIYRKEVWVALKYIEQNISHKISVPEIAKRVSLTDTYLCKVFKADVGKSIIDYINELKMNKAYKLIESNNFLIKEAAAAVGIEDQFYFNRLFKKYFGMTPKEIKHKF